MLISCRRNLSSLFLKALVDCASMTYWRGRFQSVTTLWLKKARRMRLVFLDRDSFRLCPLRLCLVFVNWKNWWGSMFFFFVTILYVSIRSPLSRHFSSVVNFEILSLSSYRPSFFSQNYYQFCISPLYSFKTLYIFLQIRRPDLHAVF